MYSETRKMTPISGGFATKAQNFEAVAQYQFDFGLRPSLGYVLSKGKDIEGVGSEEPGQLYRRRPDLLLQQKHERLR
ncbi:Outer membrane pore protein E precursor [Raoultella terrigena]|uniref:Outer membrane pore protein E n=1 Tax=Raoultella terrigena TaxID=577 RepID=A0A3P8M5A8_RAOTE|nr:Outer membrane pore protein E precursor [Raoultella terrigena]